MICSGCNKKIRFFHSKIDGLHELCYLYSQNADYLIAYKTGNRQKANEIIRMAEDYSYRSAIKHYNFYIPMYLITGSIVLSLVIVNLYNNFYFLFHYSITNYSTKMLTILLLIVNILNMSLWIYLINVRCFKSFVELTKIRQERFFEELSR